MVTGGAGKIGVHTVIELLRQGNDVTIIDNLSSSSIEVVNHIEAETGVRPKFINVNCCDYVALNNVFDSLPGIDVVVHLAVKESEEESRENPLAFYHNNIDALLTVLEVMQVHEVHRLVVCDEYVGTMGIRSMLQLSPYRKTLIMHEVILSDAVKADPELYVRVLRHNASKEQSEEEKASLVSSAQFEICYV